MNDLKVIYIIETPGILDKKQATWWHHIPAQNVTLVATMMMVLMIYLSMCGTFDNVAATSTDNFFQHKWATVTINNALGNTTQLQARCKSADNHLGLHILNTGANYSFSFRPITFGNTLFTCWFSWDNMSTVAFDIYDNDRDYDICRFCVWKINATCPCEYSYKSKNFDLWYEWKK